MITNNVCDDEPLEDFRLQWNIDTMEILFVHFKGEVWSFINKQDYKS